MGTVTLTDSEQRRSDILTRLNSRGLSGDRAALLLGLSRRQVRRLAAAYALSGMASIPHGNRGKRPHNALDPDVVTQIGELTGQDGPYRGFNVCHTRDLLGERDGIELGRSTLHNLLHPKLPALVPAKSKAVVLRTRRLREGAEGMMVQVDGSLHDWLEDRAPKFCLMGGVDDAKGAVLHLHFRPTENANGYLFMFRDIAVAHGLPMSYYHDKHTILHSPKKPTIEDELAGRTPMSHVQKVMHDLGIGSIAAHSPQAKGRIERLWKTLQDRLVKELRLARVDTMEQANAFLPGFIKRYNARFAVEAADPDTAWVALEKGCDLDYYFSMQDTRTVKADHTVSFDGKTLQICAKSRTRSLAGQTITVRVNPENKLNLYDGKRRLDYREVAPSTPKVKTPQPLRANPNPQPLDPGKAARRRGFLYAAS
jgi:transposase